MGSNGRTGHAYRKLRAQVKQRPDGYVCCRCHHPINPALRWPNPRSWSLDHLDALALGGSLLHPANAAGAHLGCNSRHGNTVKAKLSTTQQCTPVATQVW